MNLLGTLLYHAIEIYTFIIILSVIVSWLVAFGVLNVANPQAANLVRLINRAVDPVLKPVQRYVPSIGGMDISPIIVIFGLIFLQRVVLNVLL